jgi:LysM repeat protein
MDRINIWALTTALAISIAVIPVLSAPAQAASKRSLQQAKAYSAKPYKKARYKKRMRGGGGGCQNLSHTTLRNKANNYSNTIASASRQYGVNPNLIGAVITIESCFNSRAVGTSGEKGLMQLMPGTARRFNITNGFNVWQNVHGGTQYLSYLLDRYDGRTPRAVAAYNAGEGNVKKSGPIRNQSYVNKVMTAYNKFTTSGFAASLKGGKRTYLAKQDEPVRTIKARFKLASADDSVTLTPRVKREQVSRLLRQRSNTMQARTQTALPWPDKNYKAINSSESTQRAFRRAAERYAVQPGDTLYSIARVHGLSVQRLSHLNNLHDPHEITTGRSLRLK